MFNKKKTKPTHKKKNQTKKTGLFSWSFPIVIKIFIKTCHLGKLAQRSRKNQMCLTCYSGVVSSDSSGTDACFPVALPIQFHAQLQNAKIM